MKKKNKNPARRAKNPGSTFSEKHCLLNWRTSEFVTKSIENGELKFSQEQSICASGLPRVTSEVNFVIRFPANLRTISCRSAIMAASESSSTLNLRIAEKSYRQFQPKKMREIACALK